MHRYFLSFFEFKFLRGQLALLGFTKRALTRIGSWFLFVCFYIYTGLSKSKYPETPKVIQKESGIL